MNGSKVQNGSQVKSKHEIEYTSAPECNESVDIVEAEVWEERTAITITGVKHNEECPELILDT